MRDSSSFLPMDLDSPRPPVTARIPLDDTSNNQGDAVCSETVFSLGAKKSAGTKLKIVRRKAPPRPSVVDTVGQLSASQTAPIPQTSETEFWKSIPSSAWSFSSPAKPSSQPLAAFPAPATTVPFVFSSSRLVAPSNAESTLQAEMEALTKSCALIGARADSLMARAAAAARPLASSTDLEPPLAPPVPSNRNRAVSTPTPAPDAASIASTATAAPSAVSPTSSPPPAFPPRASFRSPSAPAPAPASSPSSSSAAAPAAPAAAPPTVSLASMLSFAAGMTSSPNLASSSSSPSFLAESSSSISNLSNLNSSSASFLNASVEPLAASAGSMPAASDSSPPVDALAEHLDSLPMFTPGVGTAKATARKHAKHKPAVSSRSVSQPVVAAMASATNTTIDETQTVNSLSGANANASSADTTAVRRGSAVGAASRKDSESKADEETISRIRQAEDFKNQGNSAYRSGKALYEQGQLNGATADWNRAHDLYGKAIMLRPEHAGYHANRCAAAMSLHRYKQAIEDAINGLALNEAATSSGGAKDTATLQLQRCTLLSRLVKSHMYSANFSDSAAIILQLQTTVHAMQSAAPSLHTADATKQAQAELLLLTQSQEWLSKAANHLHRGKYNEAGEDLRRGIKTLIDASVLQISDSGDRLPVALRIMLVECDMGVLLMQSSVDRTIRMLKNAHPNDSSVLCLAAKAKFFSGCTEDAEKLLTRSMRYNANHTPSKVLHQLILQVDQHRLKGNELFAASSYASAIASYDAALKLLTSPIGRMRAILLCNKAAALKAQGQIRECVTLCSDAINADPTYAKAYARRARSKLALNQLAGAVTDMEQAAAREPTDTSMKEELAGMRRKLYPSPMRDQRDRERNAGFGFRFGSAAGPHASSSSSTSSSSSNSPHSSRFRADSTNSKASSSNSSSSGGGSGAYTKSRSSHFPNGFYGNSRSWGSSGGSSSSSWDYRAPRTCEKDAIDHHAILGLDRRDKNLTENVIRKAYYSKAQEWHPDKWTHGTCAEKKHAEEQFKKVSNAHQHLTSVCKHR